MFLPATFFLKGVVVAVVVAVAVAVVVAFGVPVVVAEGTGVAGKLRTCK